MSTGNIFQVRVNNNSTYQLGVNPSHNYSSVALNANRTQSFLGNRNTSQSRSRTLDNNFSTNNRLNGLHRHTQLNQSFRNFDHQKLQNRQPNQTNHIRNPPNQQFFGLNKNQLVRTQSVNVINKHQKIPMFNRIHHLAQNPSFQRDSFKNQAKNINFKNQNPEQKIKNQMPLQIHQQTFNKTDRLENYLHKIKHQRNKQSQGSLRLENQISQSVENPQKSRHQTSQQIKDITADSFKELDKLKRQIGRIRDHAIQVQRKNSVSRDKSLKNFELEPNFGKIKQQMLKLKNLNQKLKPSLSCSPEKNVQDLSQDPIQKVNRFFSSSSHKTHMNSLFNLNSLNHNESQGPSPYLVRQGRPIDAKAFKTKVTFSFAPKSSFDS